MSDEDTKYPWHKRYHGLALNGYMPLSLEQRGAYTTLLDMMYDQERALVNNERLNAGVMGVSLRKYKILIAELINLDKIFITDYGHISNKKFEKELENKLKTSRKRAESGSKGGRKTAEKPKKPKDNNDDSAASDEANGVAYIRDKKIDVIKKEKILKRFDEFYDAYALKKSRGQAEKAWARIPIEDHTLIIEAAKVAAKVGGDYRQHPSTWLNAKGWLDDLTVKSNNGLAENNDDWPDGPTTGTGWKQ